MSAPVREEAATDEVVALASALAYLPHGPARVDDEDEALPIAETGDPADDVASPLLPRQRDEFTCCRCFLVAHVSRRARSDDDCCADCACAS